MLLKERNGDPYISHWQGKPDRKEGGKLIVVSVKRNSVRVEKLRIEGHARYEKCGKDIVCAAASILTQNLISSIEELTDDKIEYEMEEGLANIRFLDLSNEGNILINSFFIGICDIATNFPDCVKVVKN